ncbi:hypothetical protein EV361DRAFT_88999 [Lentinula raphanica]|nr:hypothetical protein FB446DRAFT_660694 [Lentinula raphanica]KAJ3827781.1 hypothetical protein F5880DRAFT_1127728 [Lentinula raphanica]KAJ3973104.1 hypothetical protein EV361DRAFT_88999 [Lentinula raphanica]
MKRSQSRAASPTPTAFSGISNYRTDSYKPISKNAPPVPQIDYRSISKIHFEELSQYLAVYLTRAAPNSRSSARQKLTRLTIQQFHELSTDVYDELIRRKGDKEVPFLPVREDFHPKRNQARQKLATLPTSRFEDLSSDVYFELARRYPEFREDPAGRASVSSNYDDYPAPGFPSTNPRATNTSRTSGRASADRPSDSGYGGSVSSRRPSQDRRRPSEDYYGGRMSDDNYASSISSRRKASQDTTIRRSEDREREREYSRRPSAAASMSGNSDSTTIAAQSTMATSGMIIPNTSTMEEEYIEVPYGRDARESGSSTNDERDLSRDRGQDPGFSPGFTEEEPDSASNYASPMSPSSPAVGLSGLSARFKNDDDDGPSTRSGDDFYDKPLSYGRNSANSDRSINAYSNRMGGRTSVNEDSEKMRRDYEYRIATMQTQISNLQRDLGDSQLAQSKLSASEMRVRQLEEELASVLRKAEEQTSAMRVLQKELDELRETRQREKERESRRAREDEEELQILRDRLESLEEERANGRGNNADAEMVEQLRSDMQNLLTEVSDLSRRNDELMTAKDSDLVVIRDLDNQLKEYKRKYEQAKTELRSVKATSQLFLQAPKIDKLEDQLPVSSDGGVLDIHVTAFLSAVDGLLTAGRSNAPTRVLSPMKSVVNAVTNIIDDVRTYEKRPSRSDVDMDTLHLLRERAEATLSNLVTASKTHATSAGMSPVSLLDAAASHVAATITDIGKLIYIRKATKAEQEQFASSTYSPGPSATNGYTPGLRSVSEKDHQRKGSAASSAFGSSSRYDNPSMYPPGRSSDDYARRTPSDNSSSDKTNSPPPIFDQPPNTASTASDGDGTEDNWAELKLYLETQTESIVYAIQNVLAGVRSPTPSPTLNEYVTQIITIVSSIVAVCKDNFPPSSAQQGDEILRELSEHANTLSEIQALPEVTKESRQVMAKSSFAIANAMKGLMKLE